MNVFAGCRKLILPFLTLIKFHQGRWRRQAFILWLIYSIRDTASQQSHETGGSAAGHPPFSKSSRFLVLKPN